MKLFLKTLVTAAAAIMATSPAAAADAENRGLMAPVNEQGWGEFSGRVQTLLMRRQYSRTGDGNSGTVSFLLNYASPEYCGLSGGAQYLYNWRFFEGGSQNMPQGGGYWIHNDDFNVLNEAYLKFNLGALGFGETHLKAGRQILDYDFAPKYEIRQKPQAFEAAVISCREIEGLTVDAGHIERVSSWSSRDDGPSSLRANFMDVEDRIGVNYPASGMQFISATLDRIENWSFTIYDLYGNDLFNTFGAKGSWTTNLEEDLQLAVKAHYIHQDEEGRMDKDGLGVLDADLAELALEVKAGPLSVQPGYVRVAGRTGMNDLLIPFRTSITIDPEMLWWTHQSANSFLGGTNSLYLKGVYKLENTLFYMLYVHADRDNQDVTQEIDFVVKHNFTPSLYASVKIGYGHTDNKNGADLEGQDYRLFAGYTF